MRGLPLIVLVVAIAGVLVLSLRSLGRERDRLLQDFASAQAAVARDVGSDLENRLKDLDEDGQLVTRLTHETWKASWSDNASREHVVRSAFTALATVVRHYRSLVLIPGDGAPAISAIDPTEGASGGEALLTASRRAAAAAGGSVSARMAGPFVLPDGRPVYLYTIPANRHMVVIAVDGERLLHGLMRSRADSRLLVADASGTLWSGCAEVSGCRHLPPGPDADAIRDLATSAMKAREAVWPREDQARLLGLPQGAFAVAAESVQAVGPGEWILLVATSADAIHHREQRLVYQLLGTAMAILAAVGLIGAFIIRQQRRAVALAERLRHAEELRSLEDQLIRAEKLATTGVLAAGIAHEIGTPLGIIRGRAELLLEQVGRGPAAGGLDAIIQQIDRIAGTIRKVLDFSRAQPVDLRPTAVPTVVNETLDLLAHRFRQQKLSVKVETAPDLPEIAADRDQLQQVLINVLLNACDASDRGGALWIFVRRGSTSSGLEMEIRDSGCGIPPDRLHAVFDPFFTTKKRGEGTGLGLPVAASIVRNHGGRISLDSTAGEGTSVRISWPVAQGEAADA